MQLPLCILMQNWAAKRRLVVDNIMHRVYNIYVNSITRKMEEVIHMKLTPEQQAMLNGEKGETMAKVVKTLVMYGDTFGAERMVPITSKYGHTVISFGLKVMKPVYDLYQEIIDAGLTSDQKFTADPKPLDKHVPSSLIEDLVFKKFMYTYQDSYEQQLRELGITNDDDYTCTCYLDQVGNKPNNGEVLSWAESSAVVYANSVLGARCNRNSGMIELMGSIAGFVPEFGLLLDENRKATWIIEVKCSKKPEAQLLGSAIGMKVMEEVPYVKGLDKWLGTKLDEEACTYLKDFGAATASNGAVGLYHIENLTPEAVEQGDNSRGRAGIRYRRCRARARQGKLPRHLERSRRGAAAVLCRLPAYDAQTAYRLDDRRRRGARQKRP